MRHTSGPWTVGGWQTGPTTSVSAPFCGGRDWPFVPVTSGCETVAVCPDQSADRVAGMPGRPKLGTGMANARLIAAAPDLLEALEQCEVVMDTAAINGVGNLLPPGYRDSWVAAHTAAREAIRKARGEEV